MNLPASYVVPQVGDIDTAGHAPDPWHPAPYCGHPVASGRWICTLPYGHWGDFHVAHYAYGRVIAVDQPPSYLRVPDGL